MFDPNSCFLARSTEIQLERSLVRFEHRQLSSRSLFTDRQQLITREQGNEDSDRRRRRRPPPGYRATRREWAHEEFESIGLARQKESGQECRRM